MTTVYSLLGQRLDEARAERGHTVDEMTRVCGCGTTTMDALRHVSDRTYARKTVEGIADYLDMTIETVRALARMASEPDYEGVYVREGEPTRRPGALVEAYEDPIRTASGIKWGPVVARAGSCEECEYWAGCRRDVFERDGLAWCEAVIEEEVLPEVVYV